MNNLEEIVDFFYPHVMHEKAFLTKISEILRTCERTKNLMVVFYLIEKDQFLFCNKAFKNILGAGSENIIDKGWDFWFSVINKSEASSVRRSLMNYFTATIVHKPLTLKYHISDFSGQGRCIQHEVHIHKLEMCTLGANYFTDISEKEKIEHCFDQSSGKVLSTCNLKKKYVISSREMEVLKLIGEGFSSKQIADILYISNHTAISHRKNLIEKFQVKNTAHLVKRAFESMHL
ncbi:MAG: helix-turn-helix transcriptional regulator [Eudoraea sp.]|nr:helix-turn-helix transcriptional regulator [Eudoraea sp.]